MEELRVVRFTSGGSGEYRKLALCIPHSGSTTKVIFDDHETIVDTELLCKAHHVNVTSMAEKATVFQSVVHGGPALRAKLPEYQDIFARLDEDLSTARALRWYEPPSATRQTTHRDNDNTAAASLKAFREDHGKAKVLPPTPLASRLQSMSDAVKAFEDTSHALAPTGWSKTRFSIDGMKPLNLQERKTMREVKALCVAVALAPPSGFVKSHSYHYGKYDKNQLVSILSLSVMKMNKMPGSICVGVDIAASIDTNHSMSIALESVKKMLRKRRNPCVLFAQVAQTDVARAFWGGKLTKTRRASVITALISLFDARYTIYSDAEDMAIFFE